MCLHQSWFRRRGCKPFAETSCVLLIFKSIKSGGIFLPLFFCLPVNLLFLIGRDHIFLNFAEDPSYQQRTFCIGKDIVKFRVQGMQTVIGLNMRIKEYNVLKTAFSCM